MKAINIDWDVDSENELVFLPAEVKIPSGMTDVEEISDYLSNITGYCHKGFALAESTHSVLERIAGIWDKI